MKYFGEKQTQNKQNNAPQFIDVDVQKQLGEEVVQNFLQSCNSDPQYLIGLKKRINMYTFLPEKASWIWKRISSQIQ